MRGREDLIGPAIKAIEDQGIAENGKVVNEFKGYIDTFGASIVHNGLIPAVIFFESGSEDKEKPVSVDSEKDKTHTNRKKMLKAILSLIKKNEEISEAKESSLYEYIKSREKNGEDIKGIRQDIVDSAIAVKLALRTFKFI